MLAQDRQSCETLQCNLVRTGECYQILLWGGKFSLELFPGKDTARSDTKGQLGTERDEKATAWGTKCQPGDTKRQLGTA